MNAVEIRRNESGIDEIVARGADVTLERVTDSSWCVTVEAQGEFWQFFIGAKNGRSLVEATLSSHVPA